MKSTFTLLFLAIAPLCMAQSGMELVGDAFLQPGDKATAHGKVRALIVGISRYRELPKDAQLSYAHSDAMNFYRFLLSPGGGKVDSTQVKLLLNEDAVAGEIYAGLSWLVESSKKGDRVIIFFAGHGDVETQTARQRGFLLAHDSPRAGYHAGGTVRVTDVQDFLETLASNKVSVLLVTDACRAGKLAGGDAGQSQTTAALQEQWTGITKILSSQPGEKSLESPAWKGGSGVFTYNLIDGLTGLADKNTDGFVTLTEINQYLSNEVPAATEGKQNPMVSGSLTIRLSQVDAAELAVLKLRKNNELSTGPVVAARANVNADTLSDATQKNYRAFRDALNRKDLVETPGKNAYHYYQLMAANNPKGSDFVADMRRALISALETNSQKVINRFMVNDKSLNSKQVHRAATEMKTAVDLMDPSAVRYKSMVARELFLENGFLYCICHDTESTEEEANAALAKLRKSAVLEPEAAYVYNSMGNVFYSRRNYDSAKFYYIKASSLAPKWTYPIVNMGTLNNKIGNRKEAIRYYEAALQIDPSDPSIYNFLGIYYEGDKAVANYKRAVELNPDEPVYLYNLGLQYMDKKSTRAQGDTYFRKLSDIQDGGYWLSEVAVNSYYQDDYARIWEYFMRSMARTREDVKLAPDDASAYQDAGYVYYRCWRYFSAIGMAQTGYGFGQDSLPVNRENYFNLSEAAYQKAIELDSVDAVKYEALADLYQEAVDEKNVGSYESLTPTELLNEKALTYYEKALALNPDEKHGIYTGLFKTYKEKGDSLLDTRVEEYALKSIETAEKDEKANCIFGYAGWLSAKRRDQESLQQFELALRTGLQASSDDYMSMATIAFRLRQPEKVKQFLDKGLPLAQKEKDKYNQAMIHLAYAELAVYQKDTRSAMNSIQTSLKLDKSLLDDIKTDNNLNAIKDTAEYKALIAKYEAEKSKKKK